MKSTIKSRGVSRRLGAVVFLSSLPPLSVFFLFLLPVFFFFLFFFFFELVGLWSSELIFSCPSNYQDVSFLNPPCSKEQVLLGQHKDGEIVETCKCLLAICDAKKTKGFRRP